MLTEPNLTPGEISGLTAEATPASGDFVAIVDISSGHLKKATLANLSAGIDHGTLAGLSDDDHSQYSLADGTRWTTTQTANRAIESDGSGNLVVSTVTSTELGYLSGVTSGIQAQLNALVTGYARRESVIARVDNTAVPPTEVSGDRYLLDATGASHANWDGAAANDIVEYDGASWVATTPAEGWVVYSDGSGTDWLFIDDGSPQWTERPVATTDHGSLSGLSDDDHSQYSLADGTRWTTTQTADRATMTDGSGNLVVSTVTSTELGYLSGVTSAIQTQLDGKLANVSADTTPQLGGSLDVNGQKIVSVSNGNIDIEPHGTGNVLLGNLTFDADQTVGAGQDNYVLTYDHAAGTIALESASGGGGSLPVDDTTAIVQDPVDNTKLVRIDAGAITTGTTRVITMGDRDVDLASGGTFAENSHNHDASYQPLDSDLTTIAAANNGSVLASTTASFLLADETKLDGIETGADVTDATNVNAAGAVMNTDTTTAAMSFVIDEDTMASNLATKVPTQQSVKAYVDSVAAGVANWTEANATPVANEITSWTPSSGSTNVTAAIVPKGTGAFVLQVADGTTAGGNDRGSYAVDLQTVRSAAAEVASGLSSFVVGGQSKATNQYAVAMGGENDATNTASTAIGQLNTASGSRATALGYNNTASGNNTLAAGYLNTASGLQATALGAQNTVSGANAFAVGNSCTADADYSTAVGFYADADGIYGKRAAASGRISSSTAQSAEFTLRAQTTDATATKLTTNNSTAGTNNQIVLQNSSAVAVEVLVIGKKSATETAAGYRLTGVFRRGASAGTLTQVGSTISDAFEDAAAAGWSADFVADTTNGAVSVQVTGQSSTTINWVGTATISEVLA